MTHTQSRQQPPSEVRSLSIALTGSGGAGVITAGGMIVEAAARAGWYALMTRSVGPQIRGGEAAALVRLSTAPVETHNDRFDILLALDWLNFERFAGEIPLAPQTVAIVDPAAGEVPEVVRESGATRLDLPLQALLEANPGIRANMLALGVIAALIGLKVKDIDRLIVSKLAHKGERVVTASQTAVRLGVDAAADFMVPVHLTAPQRGRDRWLISGNQATGLGAVRGGIRFVAGYPITPATEVLEWMAPALAKVGGTLVQAEDELASINMAIGASFGGTPSLTATSGPGFALMTEALGLATAAEIPVVVVDVMRGGPSTGIPTKSEQSDLNIAIYGCHGDAPHIVVAPMSIGDCLFTTQWAVHLAETLQVPTVVLSDQYLGQARAVVDAPADVAFVSNREIAGGRGAEPYARYAVGGDCVSPMAVPGTSGCQYTADGLAHTERGLPSTRADDHLAQLDKRSNKLTRFDYGRHWGMTEGDGEMAVITWGSTTAPVREALERLRDQGFEARLVALRLIAPVPTEQLALALKGVHRALIVEQTHSRQFYHYLRGHCDLPADTRGLNRPGPLPFRAGELVDEISKWQTS